MGRQTCIGEEVRRHFGNLFLQGFHFHLAFLSLLNDHLHPKDFESPDRYQMIAFIIFRDLESLNRIPELGEEFIVLAPEIPKKPIHEIGVKDLEQYAGNDEFQPEFQFDKPEADTTKRVIGGNIRHSSMSSLDILNIRVYSLFYQQLAKDYSSNPSYHSIFQRTPQKTMQHFLNWGGFNPAQLDTSRVVQERDLFKPGAREENTRMRAALQLCSRLTSEPIPQGPAPTDSTPEKETVPTPETARIFAGLYDRMPASALRRLRRAEVDQEADDFGEECVSSTSSATTSAAASPDTPALTLEKKEHEQTDLSLSTTPSSPPATPQPIKRPPVSPEEKQKLESQLHAARLLQKATAPVRRKKLQPAVIEPAKKLKLQQRLLDPSQTPQVNPFVVEDKKEKTGFLAKLASLFGQ